MNIRPATPKDSLLISSLCRDVQSLHADQHPELFKMPKDDDFAMAYFDEVLADSEVVIYIAEEDSHALGYVFCRLINHPETALTYANRFMLIDQISVRPDAQRKGVGTALMRRVDVLTREWGLTRIQLHSWDFNTDAHAFFEKFGFRKFNYRFWRNL